MSVTVRKQVNPPPWRNTAVLKWVAQLVFLFGFIAIAVIIVRQVQSNLSERLINFDFKWLDGRLGFPIREGIDTDPATGGRNILVGIVNTLRITVFGILAATLLGTIVGVARLSNNWIVQRLSTLYVESIRNIPLLLQILFWGVVSQTFFKLDPADPDTLETGQYFFAPTRKGIGVVWVQPWGGFYQWLIWVLIGAVAGFFVHRRLFRQREDEGRETYPNLSALGVLLVFAVIGWFAHPVWGWLGGVFDAIGGAFTDLPTMVYQLVFAGAALAVGFFWIKRFLDDRRTPSGLAKLTDDDWFRMIFAGFLAVAAAGFFLIFSGFSSQVGDISGSFFSDWLAPKFDSATNVIDVPISQIEADVAAGMTLEQIAVAQGLDADSAHKLVDGLTSGFVDRIDTGISNGSLTAGQVAAELEVIKSRADYPLRWSRPVVEARGANFLALSPNSGIVMTPGFFALWIAVTLYTASFIAEIVRGGILAISKGQNEAAGALGLTRSQALRFVILPQAFRIIFPPLGNQYLNLFKNTSLGIAVAYPEIVQIGQTVYNQNGQTIPVLLIWMAFFLVGSLLISAIVNYYNRRTKLVER